MKYIAIIFLLIAAPCFAAPPTDELSDGFQQLAQTPWTSAEDIKRSAFGISSQDGAAPDGEYPTVRHEIRQNYYGSGIHTRAGDGRIIDCISRHNYIGARLASSDSEIRGCRLLNNRDVGLWIARDAGNCQSTQNHCYGARIACFNAGGAWYRAVNDTYADALIGYWGDGGECTLTNVLFQHNSVRDAVLRGGDQHLVNCIVLVQREVKANDFFSVPGMQVYARKVGVDLGGECSIRGGIVRLTDFKHPLNEYSGNPAEAIRVNGDSCVIETHLVDSDGIDGSIGIRIKGARRGQRVDCFVTGFSQARDRIFVVEDAAHTIGLDITLRINGVVKPIGDYIDIGLGWKGSIRLINTATGKTNNVPEGEAK